MTDLLKQNKSIDEQRSVKKIASFEPRESPMKTENNNHHQLIVCIKKKRR